MDDSNINANLMEQEEMPIYLLQQQVPMIVKEVQVQMRKKSTKTRQNCFLFLKELCSVLSGALTQYIGDLMAEILFSLNEKNEISNIKIDGLSFVYCLLTTHPPEVVYPYIHTLLPSVVQSVRDSSYKITAKALEVLKELVKVIRPIQVQTNFNFRPFVKDIYMCTLMKLKQSDIDQEVKEKAICTMGQIISNLEDYLDSELHVCLKLFLDRLKNEITLLQTVKALTKIAASPLRIKLPILDKAMPVLCLFLRKDQRALKLSTLQLLDILIKNYHTSIIVSFLFIYTITSDAKNTQGSSGRGETLLSFVTSLS